jgi:hypothetical protein
MARVLLAAPQLRTFGVGPTHSASEDERVCGDVKWLTASHAPLAPAFMGLVHPRLRRFGVAVEPPPGSPSRDKGCASRLRRMCFAAKVAALEKQLADAQAQQAAAAESTDAKVAALEQQLADAQSEKAVAVSSHDADVAALKHQLADSVSSHNDQLADAAASRSALQAAAASHAASLEQQLVALQRELAQAQVHAAGLAEANDVKRAEIDRLQAAATVMSQADVTSPMDKRAGDLKRQLQRVVPELARVTEIALWQRRLLRDGACDAASPPAGSEGSSPAATGRGLPAFKTEVLRLVGDDTVSRQVLAAKLEACLSALGDREASIAAREARLGVAVDRLAAARSAEQPSGRTAGSPPASSPFARTNADRALFGIPVPNTTIQSPVSQTSTGVAAFSATASSTAAVNFGATGSTATAGSLAATVGRAGSTARVGTPLYLSRRWRPMVGPRRAAQPRVSPRSKKHFNSMRRNSACYQRAAGSSPRSHLLQPAIGSRMLRRFPRFLSKNLVIFYYLLKCWCFLDFFHNEFVFGSRSILRCQIFLNYE